MLQEFIAAIEDTVTSYEETRTRGSLVLTEHEISALNVLKQYLQELKKMQALRQPLQQSIAESYITRITALTVGNSSTVPNSGFMGLGKTIISGLPFDTASKPLLIGKLSQIVLDFKSASVAPSPKDGKDKEKDTSNDTLLDQLKAMSNEFSSMKATMQSMRKEAEDDRQQNRLFAARQRQIFECTTAFGGLLTEFMSTHQVDEGNKTKLLGQHQAILRLTYRPQIPNLDHFEIDSDKSNVYHASARYMRMDEQQLRNQVAQDLESSSAKFTEILSKVGKTVGNFAQEIRAGQKQDADIEHATIMLALDCAILKINVDNQMINPQHKIKYKKPPIFIYERSDRLFDAFIPTPAFNAEECFRELSKVKHAPTASSSSSLSASSSGMVAFHPDGIDKSVDGQSAFLRRVMNPGKYNLICGLVSLNTDLSSSDALQRIIKFCIFTLMYNNTSTTTQADIQQIRETLVNQLGILDSKFPDLAQLLITHAATASEAIENRAVDPNIAIVFKRLVVAGTQKACYFPEGDRFLPSDNLAANAFASRVNEPLSVNKIFQDYVDSFVKSYKVRPEVSNSTGSNGIHNGVTNGSDTTAVLAAAHDSMNYK